MIARYVMRLNAPCARRGFLMSRYPMITSTIRYCPMHKSYAEINFCNTTRSRQLLTSDLKQEVWKQRPGTGAGPVISQAPLAWYRCAATQRPGAHGKTETNWLSVFRARWPQTPQTYATATGRLIWVGTKHHLGTPVPTKIS